MKWIDDPMQTHMGGIEQATLNNRLRDAVRYGEPMEVRHWIDKGAKVRPESIEEAMPFHQPLLHVAASHGRPTVVETLIGADPECIKERDFFGRTALHVAALEGHADVAHALIQMGVDPKAEDLHEFTAADLALARGHDHVLAALKGNGVEIKAHDDVERLRAEVDSIYPGKSHSFVKQVRQRREDGPDFPTGIPIR